MMTASTIAADVRAGRRTAVSVAEASLAAIAAGDAALNAFTHLDSTRALRTAAMIDAVVAAGGDPGPLAGVPFAVKNLFDLDGVTTIAGSKIEAGRPPATRDAFLVRRLLAAGAVPMGALNMDEYAYGFTTENAHYGPAHNPHDLNRMAGGSSGGSAAAVAGGLVPLSLGSDTNGSIRVPSAMCGIFGIKPTYGRLARTGSYLFAASFDHLGPFARSLEDLALAYDALQGLDPEDPAQSPAPVTMVTGLTGIEGLRIGVAGGHFARNAHPEALAAVGIFAAALGATTTVDLPLAAAGRAAAFLITMAEGGNLHLPDLISRAEDFDPATRDRFLAGTLLPAVWVQQAQRVRAAWRAQALAAFEHVDCFLTPTLPCVAPPIGQATMVVDGETLPTRPMLGVFTQPISCIGLPAMAVPLARPDGLPLSVQLVAAPWREDILFRVAGALVAAGVAGAPVVPGLVAPGPVTQS
ncbi:amidase/aspartyl-tRNA(Asn)/glutamyl-tRNA(Gln) amidotransferase subunit A [Humitalea rosea]|uniref:Amidase/aspartyl-tRNA(Asn)/glutamyl-tRNA(Gln) amidotransferase subunit A n=1 Tax=Humitalea rosea TaxID=990373 RepID=A0A2W7IRV1_9PROT|nr:AtzE family amidohydrolase [Humitalea rosea]PZW50326.1 amidase/aspartyl-tRNA(Asn)/glutamyl-tRNA(Gln) amidotransferase subunit A [Humitalea rosea]